jgi:hypothetical protein
MLTATQRVIALAFVLAATTATNSLAQETAPDPDTPETMGAETTPEQGTGSALQQAQEAPTDQPEMTGDLMGSTGACKRKACWRGLPKSQRGAALALP